MSSAQGVITYDLKSYCVVKLPTVHFDLWGSRQGYITHTYLEKSQQVPLIKLLKTIINTLMLTLNTLLIYGEIEKKGENKSKECFVTVSVTG